MKQKESITEVNDRMIAKVTASRAGPEPKLLWSIGETCEQLNLSRSTVLALTYAGQLPSVTIGRRRMFPSNKVRDWAASLPGATPLTWEEIADKSDLEARRTWSQLP